MDERKVTADSARRRAAETVLREAADAWSQDVNDLEPATVLAVFLRALSARVNIGWV